MPWKTWVCVSRAVARACRPTPTDPTACPVRATWMNATSIYGADTSA